ncbi:MAG: hypothetical protein LYZ69_05425 [Nitrososphaerales archaeon]|nr:hypothetical protein [Nitrososphaerales archaeon]
MQSKLEGLSFLGAQDPPHPLGEHSEVTSTFLKHWQEAEQPVESKFASEALSGALVVDGDFVIIDYRLDKLVLLVLEKEPATSVSVSAERPESTWFPGSRRRSEPAKAAVVRLPRSLNLGNTSCSPIDARLKAKVESWSSPSCRTVFH